MASSCTVGISGAWYREDCGSPLSKLSILLVVLSPTPTELLSVGGRDEASMLRMSSSLWDSMAESS